MKKYLQFIKEEISIKGNQGVPNEYLSKVDREASIRNRQIRGGYPEMMQKIDQSLRILLNGIAEPRDFMMDRLSDRQKQRISTVFKQLEKLAEDVIKTEYADILQNTDLDIKLVMPREVTKLMKGSKGDIPPKPNLQKLDDPNIRKEVDRRKINNNIMQGEGINTKMLLHTDMVKDKVEEMFPRKSDELIQLWNDISILANKMDWEIPLDVKVDMMENAPGGFAGAVKVEWNEKKKTSEEILNDNDDEEQDDEEQDDKSYVSTEGTPTIIVRAVDFPMLLHETVKGIHELISSASIHPDQKTAEIVQMNTSSFEDEAEDFRYGPYIAATIRDFVNQSPNMDRFPNMREFVYGKMNEMTTDDFLDLIKRILMSKVNNNDDVIARRKVNTMIYQIIETLSQYDMETALDKYNDDDKYKIDNENDYDDVLDGDEGDADDEISKLIANTNKPKEEESGEIDYSKMSQRELQNHLNQALDDGDYATVDKIRQIIYPPNTLNKF